MWTRCSQGRGVTSQVSPRPTPPPKMRSKQNGGSSRSLGGGRGKCSRVHRWTPPSACQHPGPGEMQGGWAWPVRGLGFYCDIEVQTMKGK